MKFRFMPENPKEISFTMTTTMTLKEWELLGNQLDEQWPSWKLSSAIKDLLLRSEQVFCVEQKAAISDD